MSHHLNIDTVAIIESLPAIEKQTGKLLEETLKKMVVMLFIIPW